MQSFLEEVVADVYKKLGSFDHISFILPSKRAGSFLKNIIATNIPGARLAPRVYSIESFVEEVSGLNYATNTDLLFELYTSYSLVEKGERDSFYQFSKWGQVLLQDFNEIDRFLLDQDRFFNYLSEIRSMEHWSLKPDQTSMISDYIRFWKNLGPIYYDFKKRLLVRGIAYQGLAYREASRKIRDFAKSHTTTTHIFVGFNALNRAETNILRYLVEEEGAFVYWDADTYFLNDDMHEAGYFMRQWKKTFPGALTGVHSSFEGRKQIDIVAVPRHVSQLSYVNQKLREWKAATDSSPLKTAVVLGDEGLLNPLLHALPPELGAVNITMGFPLSKSSLAGLFASLFDLYMHQHPNGWFYKKVIAVLNHPYLEYRFTSGNRNMALEIIGRIRDSNLLTLTPSRLKALAPSLEIEIDKLFVSSRPEPLAFLKMLSLLAEELRQHLTETGDSLALEQLFAFFKLFNQLNSYVSESGLIKDIQTLHGIYLSLLANETVDFRGEPLQGLQVMGVLESRNLDFDRVVITSVNEGVLPAGKSQNSFIPYELKKEYGLPTHQEKDAVYAYHFYRLLQRAREIVLIYNTEADVLEGGERSRFISQILADPRLQAYVSHRVAAPTADISPRKQLQINKDPDLQERIKEYAASGFSPTSLGLYIRDPMSFYKSSILKIAERMEVEETVSARDFGSIIHQSLESLYTPLLGKLLNRDNLQEVKTKIPGTLLEYFRLYYPVDEINKGKNLIARNVLQSYLERFIEMEQTASEKHSIRLISLETKMKVRLALPQLPYPVFLKGTLDRVDEIDGQLRIIDYKSGKVEPSELQIRDWEELIRDEKATKALQLLCYAYMLETAPVLAAVVSFKNLGKGVMHFAQKEAGSRSPGNMLIDNECLASFAEQLQHLLLEITNANIPFIEAEN